MGIRDALFGKKKKPPTALQKPAPSSAELKNDPNLVRVFDEFGKELFVTKEQWRTNILPGSIKASWDNADRLYSIVVTSLNDGLRSDILAAAAHLYKIDSGTTRAVCVWGIVLMEEGRLDEAEKVYRDFLAKHGKDGVILTNLAKVYARRKNDAESEKILWTALENDPNQNNGVSWYEAIHRERGGEAAGIEALRRICSISGSWRAQLWLARIALKSGDLKEASALYRESLSRADKNVPADLLMQISGDLGNQGCLTELLELVEPQFAPEIHGLAVGNNLIKAHVDLGHLDSARQILDRLYALKRPDWGPTLSYWDTEIAKRHTAKVVVNSAPLSIEMLCFEGPIWLTRSSQAAALFSNKNADAPVICLLGCTAEMPTGPDKVQIQMPDAPGRISRATPLFLAEQVEFGSTLRAQCLVPWISEPASGFVLSGVAWKDQDAAKYSTQSPIKSDYVATIHLRTQAEKWELELRLLRSNDGECFGNLKVSLPPEKPEEAMKQLAQKLIQLLIQQKGAAATPLSPIYQVPAKENFPYYLLRLEQLMAVRCAASKKISSGFLSGEREIINGVIQLCIACPGSVSVRLLFAQILSAMDKVRPDILPEFKEKVSLLQQKYPLAGPAQDIIQQTMADIYD